MPPPVVTGVLRARPEDFYVSERLDFEPSGDGPHVLVRVEKRGVTTLDLLAEVARSIGVRPQDVGYCGLKDRHAVTRQWLSVPGDDRHDWSALGSDNWRVIEHTRNRRKLRIGAHAGNAFAITVRELQGAADDLDERLAYIRAHGVPNYFGPQRFGINGDNLRRARRWFIDGERLKRRQRRFALSAARSWLFNRVLGARVAAASWESLLPGEPACLEGSRSFFLPEDAADDEIAKRLARFDIHPSGPLWGRGESPARDACVRLEAAAAAELAWLAAGLESAGPKQERRALRLPVRELELTRDRDTLTLRFTLGKGSFATSVLHELLDSEQLRIFA